MAVVYSPPDKNRSIQSKFSKSPSTLSVASTSDSTKSKLEDDEPITPKRRKTSTSTTKNVHTSPTSMSTESVDSTSDLSTGDVDDDFPSVPQLKRSYAFRKESTNKATSPDVDFLQRFTVPVSQKLKHYQSTGEEVDDKVRNKFIRECVTCLPVASHSKTITSKEFQLAAKKICKTLPIMRDPQPPNSSKDVVFPYWVRNNFHDMFKGYKVNSAGTHIAIY